MLLLVNQSRVTPFLGHKLIQRTMSTELSALFPFISGEPTKYETSMERQLVKRIKHFTADDRSRKYPYQHFTSLILRFLALDDFYKEAVEKFGIIPPPIIRELLIASIYERNHELTTKYWSYIKSHGTCLIHISIHYQDSPIKAITIS